jgi:hypothetical protein
MFRACALNEGTWLLPRIMFWPQTPVVQLIKETSESTRPSQWFLLKRTVKSKAVPPHIYGGSGGEEVWLLPIHDLVTRWGWVFSVMPWPLFTRGERTPDTIVKEDGWAPEPVWTLRLEEKSSFPCRESNLDRPVVQSVARHYIDWATPPPKTNCKVKQSRYTPWRRLGERRYSSYSFTTSALDGGEWSASRPGRALPPGKGSPVPIEQEAGWAPKPVWTQRLEENSLPLPGIERWSPGRRVRSRTL